MPFEREYGERTAGAEVVEKTFLLACWGRTALKEARAAAVLSMAGRIVRENPIKKTKEKGKSELNWGELLRVKGSGGKREDVA